MDKLALGVMEMVNGKDMVESGFTEVGALQRVGEQLRAAMALIHAAEMDRLGPGPVTPS